MVTKMRKIIVTVMISGMLLLSGCGDSLPEDELVENGQAFEMQQASDDMQASNFPFDSRNTQGQKDFPRYRIPLFIPLLLFVPKRPMWER